jgi:hypothetical protein
VEQQADTQLVPSRKLRAIRVLSSINVYGLFFAGGIAIANLSRLFPYGGAIYAGLMLSAIGLSLLKAEVDGQKLIMLALCISAIAFWDAVIQFLFQPVFIAYWILPLWQCILYGLGSFMILLGILSVLTSAPPAKS